MLIALDTETTGLDFRHGAQPFFTTICNEEGTQSYWEWQVDPYTRVVDIPSRHAKDIRDRVEAADEIVIQNSKFDTTVLNLAGIVKDWPWHKTHDTLISGHLLASNHRHNLTDMAMEYLDVDIEPFEKAVNEACDKARRLVRTKKFKLEYGEIRIAKKDEEDMPSAKDKTWKYDMWLPKTLAIMLDYPLDHDWYKVTEEYANADSVTTVHLWLKHRELMEERGLWEIYKERMKVVPVYFDIEHYGITISKKRKDEKYVEYEEEAERNHRICVNVADGEIDHLPINGRSNALNQVIFDKFQLKSNKVTKKGNESMDKDVLAYWLQTLDPTTKPYVFIKNLQSYRKRKTAMGYMDGYERFWIDMGISDWFRLHPLLNPTGTDTLRASSNNPNEQNISKKEGFNLRYCFGPAPGREWYSNDAENIELRLPMYECREEDMLALFECPNDPPYFGSNHLLIAHILWPKQFNECTDIEAFKRAQTRDGIDVELYKRTRNPKAELNGKIFKELYADTLYQWTKNGNFAVQYGAVVASGTADRAYHQAGAQIKVQKRFKKLSELNRYWIDFANRNGYVETIPDKRLGGSRGYPLLCTRTNYGKILETVPLNYHVQGSACWWMQTAMIRCNAKLKEWRDKTGFDGHIIMQVHDEMVFDFPKLGDPVVESKKIKESGGKAVFRSSNLWRIKELQRIMTMSGDDIGIPTPVSCKYHEHNWSEGVSV